jgi:methionine-rich copper-binding protein CopC
MKIGTPHRFAVAIIFPLAVLVAFTARPAFAHAVLLSSTPQRNGTVNGPDLTISLKYNSRVDGARSSLSLLKPDGTVVKISTPTQSAPDQLSATSHGLVKGTYVLRWQVLASDGHITRGEVPFQVQ